MENKVRNASCGDVLAAAGPDLYQSGQLLRAIADRFSDDLDFEVHRYDGAGLRTGDLKRHILESSLFSSGKLIIITDAHQLGKSSAAELFEAIETGLSDTAIFLSSSKVPTGSALLKKLMNAVPFFICYEPFENEMPGWAKKLASIEGITLKRDALQLLTEYSGRNLWRLADKMMSLAMFHGSGTIIDRKGLLEVIAGKDGKDVFHLGNMIFSDRRDAALDSAWSLLTHGEEPVQILAYVFSQWKKVARAIEIIESGGGKREVSKETGARYKILESLMRFSRTACKVDSVTVAEAFAEADNGLKTGADHLVIFARLIFTLTSDNI